MERIRVGIAGLGRLGKVHAENIAYKIPEMSLDAVCSLHQSEVDAAKEELGAKRGYTNFEDMAKDPDLDAIAIITTSAMHCEHVKLAMENGKHVFCEKPLGITLDECLQTEKVIEAHPDLKFMLGFMRRFDPSYAYAKEKIDSGAIGTPYLIQSTGLDPEYLVQGAIKYCKGSGGIFMDMGVHDMDMMRWFLKAEPVEVTAIGQTFKYHEFRDADDDENAIAMYRFDNGAVATIHEGRIAPHGYHIETEIIGTEGSIHISPVPQKNLAYLYDSTGVRQECVQSFPERFEVAYLAEMQHFADCLINDKTPGVSVYDGTAAVRIGNATTEAWKSGKTVKIEK